MFYRYYWDKGFVQSEFYDDLQEIAQGIHPDAYPPFKIEKYINCTKFLCPKIVHLSDLHDQKFGEKQKYLISEVDKLSPDIIVLSGDIGGTNTRLL